MIASGCTTNWDSSPARTRITIVHVKSAAERKFATPQEYLSKIGEWIVDSPFQSVGLATDASGWSMFPNIVQ